MALAGFWLGPLAHPSAAAGPQPTFELPFSCGDTVTVDRHSSEFHSEADVDFNYPGLGDDDRGKPIRASAPGKVRRSAAAIDQALGRLFVDHGVGWRTEYTHLDPIHVMDGQTVDAGTILGEMSDKGKDEGYATGVHLHWTIISDDNEVRAPVNTKQGRSMLDHGATYTSTNCAENVPSLDLALLIDTTGSMGDDIAQAKDRAAEIVDMAKAEVPDTRIALAEFRDFPGERGVPTGDYPYRDVQPFTSSADDAKLAVGRLSLGHGGDNPEAQFCALMHIIRDDRCAGRGADTAIGAWRAGAAKAVIFLTDAPPLSPEPHTGYTARHVVEAAGVVGASVRRNAAVPAGWSAPSLTINAAAGPEGSEGRPVRLYPVIVGSSSEAMREGEELARDTGGRAFNSPTASEVVEAIKAAVAEAADDTAETEAGGLVRIVARHSGMALDVKAQSKKQGAAVYQWPVNGQANQLWRIEDAGDGFVRIVASHSGMALDVKGQSKKQGAAAYQWPVNGQANQQWKVEQLPDGFVKIIARHSGMLLDVKGQSTKQGAAVYQWPDNGQANQQWRIEPVP